MKQQPSRLKFKKYHKSSKSFMILKEQKVFLPLIGNYCIMVKNACKLDLKQIEACRKSIRRSLKKTGVVTIKTFTHHSITKKAIGTRMGKGKGNHNKWICPVRAGQAVCELTSIHLYKALKALKSAGNKLPSSVKVHRLKY